MYVFIAARTPLVQTLFGETQLIPNGPNKTMGNNGKQLETLKQQRETMENDGKPMKH